MRGRYEKPRQKRGSRPQQPPVRHSEPYPGSYQPDPRYQNYENQYSRQPEGYQPLNDTGSYPDYGCQQPYAGFESSQNFHPQNNKGGFGWALLGFFFPLVGLILFLVWKKTAPGKARSAGKGALTGFILTIVMVLVLAAAAFFGGKSYLNGMLDKVNKVEVNVEYTQATEAPVETTAAAVETTAETTEPPHVPSREDYVNFLFVGQSSRGADDIEQARFADSMMLVTLNTFEKKITMTSLLRDTLVHPPQFRGKTFGQIKLTTVYHLGSFYDNGNIGGSMELMDMTLFENFGVEVDHNIEVDFAMFEAIINKMHCITMDIDQAEADYLNQNAERTFPGVYGEFKEGTNNMDGFTALAFARMRHAEGDGDSDIKRTARQQRMVSAVLDKLKTLSISELQDLANSILPMISTSMSNEEMMDMMKLVIPMLKDLTIESGGTCPANYKGELLDIYKDGMMHSVLRFNPEETKKHMRELTLGEVPVN